MQGSLLVQVSSEVWNKRVHPCGATGRAYEEKVSHLLSMRPCEVSSFTDAVTDVKPDVPESELVFRSFCCKVLI